MATALQEVEPGIAWEPLSAPQEALITCPVEDVFYGGARGGGKTDALLGDFAAHAGTYGKTAHGILFRRTYPELEQVEQRAREIYAPLGWVYNETKKTWRAPNGATLKLRYLLRDADSESYQGHSYTWQGWDELTNWASSVAVDKLWATLRSPDGVPCYRRSTGNPGGAGHGWVKRRYIDPAPEGYTVFKQRPNPKFPDLTIESVFIPSTLDDNPKIAASGYESRIAAATGDNAALWEAWRFGRWDVFVGQQYQEFRPETHVITGKAPRDFPASTEWFASMDWGYNRGTYGLHAVDGDGRVELVWECYDLFTNLTDEQAAQTIMEASAMWPRPRIIYADQQMWQKVGTRMTLVEGFRAGLAKAIPGDDAFLPVMKEAKHPPGSREVKVALIHRWLATKKDADGAIPRDEGGRVLPWALPMYRVHARCTNTIRVLQEIPADPENPNDVDPDYADDHPHDMAGFAVSARPMLPESAVNYGRIDKDKHPGWDVKNGHATRKHQPHAVDRLNEQESTRRFPSFSVPRRG